MDDEPRPPGPVKEFPRKGDKQPTARMFRCLRCGAAFLSAATLENHTEKGHAVEV